MDSSIKSRNVVEPKLHDFTSADAAIFPEKIKGQDLTDYGWNIPGSSNMLASTFKSHSKNSAIHVGFKEPLVSYHQQNDPLAASLTSNDQDNISTPQGRPAVTRFLNSSAAADPVKPVTPVPGPNLLLKSGVAKTVTYHDSHTIPSDPQMYSKTPPNSGKDSDSKHYYSLSPNKQAIQSLKKHNNTEKLKQRRMTDDNSEALARLKETIKKQKENRSPSSVGSADRQWNYYRHDETPISSMYHVKPDAVPVRKIAVGPPAPKYKGFNAAKTRLQTPDGKIWREDDLGTINDTFGISTEPRALFQEASPMKSMHKSYGGYAAKPAGYKPNKANKNQAKKKPVRKIGKIMGSHSAHKKSIITPSSWREGQRVAKAMLDASSKQTTMQSVKSNPAKENKPRPVRDESLSTTTESVVKDLLTKDPAKPLNNASVSSNIGKLSKEAKDVLDDMNLPSSSSSSDEDDDRPRTATPDACPRPKIKRPVKRKPQPSLKEYPEIPKIRHYDPVQVQQYIAKQKADRKRKQMEEKRLEKAANDKKNKLLHDLDQRQKVARKKAIAAEGQPKEKRSTLQDTYSKPEPTADESPKGYKERIASFMEKLDKINNIGIDKKDSPERNQPKENEEPVSKFLLKLGECMQDSMKQAPHATREDSAPAPERQRVYNDSVPFADYYQKPVVDASFQPTKMDRIAALRAKSESLQDRIDQESKKILEQPGFNLSFADRFSPRKTDRPPPDPKRLPAPRYHLTPSTSSPLQGKSDTSSELSYPGMSNLLSERSDRDKSPSASTSHASPRDGVVGFETWEVPDDNQQFPISRRTDPSNADPRPAEAFSLADMMYGLNKEEFCAKDRPTWRDRNNESEREDPGIKKHFEQRHSPRMDYQGLGRSSELRMDARSRNEEQDIPPWQRSNGDKYSVMNLFTKKYLKTRKPLHSNREPSLRNPDHAEASVSPSAPPKEDPVLMDVDHPTICDPSSRLPSAALDLAASPRPITGAAQDVVSQTDPTTELIKWSETLGRSKGVERKDQEEMDTDTSTVSEPRFHPLPATQANNNAMRFSPAVLEQKLALELNRCDTIEEQIKQLASSERTQGVAMAQQETVSIAQILQSRQMEHEREMERLALQAKEKALEASQQLQAVQASATAEKSAQKDKVAEEKAKIASQMQEETRKNLKLQNEVAQASIKALRRLGGGRGRPDTSDYSKSSSYTTSHTTGTMSRDGNYDSTSFDSYSESLPKQRRPHEDDHSPTSIVSEHSTTSVRPHDSGSIPEEIEQSGGVKGRSSTSSSIKEVFDTDGDEKTDRSISEHIVSSPKPSKHKEKGSKDLSSMKKMQSQEEVSDAASVQFDDTLTEDEIMEISKRAIMPSESYRRHQAKKPSMMKVPGFMLDQSEVSLSSDDASPAKNKSYFSGLDESVMSSTSLFGDHDSSSFNQFMSDRVRQYMLEQEVRARHQAAMLKLREKALKEKTEVDLAWLECKKKQIRNKGDDDKMPPLKKKKRAILLRWQVEKEEIEKLKAANKAASHDRELMKQQQKDINRIMLNTQHMKEKLKAQGEYDGKPKSSIAGEIKSSTPVPQLLASGASESEDITESDASLNTSSTSHLLQRLKKSLVGLDSRRLTAREKVLLKRKKEAEKLLEWKRKLDEEEKKVYNMEKQALDAWGRKEHSKSPNTTHDKDITPQNLKREEKTATSNALSSVAEEIITPRSDSTITSIQHELKSSLRPQEMSSEDTLEEDYTQSFESADLTVSKNERKTLEDSSKETRKIVEANKTSALTTKADATTPLLGRQSPIRARGPRRRDAAESWSDESFSQTQSETEQSDVECRVHALKEELKRRRLIADRLKKQQKKKQKEHLRAQEASLKSQIEAYDAFIKTTQQELNLELESPSSGTPSSLPHAAATKPQIRSPRKNDQSRHISRSLRHSVPPISSPDASPRAGSQKYPVVVKQQSDSESSGRSSRSLSFEDEQHSPEDATTPNGSTKSLLHNLSSRSNADKSNTSPEIPAALQDRPKKLDFASSKGLRSMIPIPSTKLSNSSGKFQQEKTPPFKPTVLQQKTDKPKSITSTSPPSSSSEDADKDVSIATEEEVSEHFSEASTDKSGASLPLFDLTNQQVDNLTDDDKTPMASPSATPTPDHPDNQLMPVEDLGLDVADGTVEARREFPDFQTDISIKSVPEVGEDLEKRVASNQQKVSDITDDLFNHLLQDSVEAALSTRKSMRRSRLPIPERERHQTHNDLIEHPSVDLSTPDKKSHADSGPKLTPSAKNLLQLFALEDEGEKKADQLSNDMTSSLMDETIFKVLAIRKVKEEKLKASEGTPHKSQQEQENGKEIEDIVRNAEESEVEPTFLRPVSPVFGASQDTDEWFDDDFGLSKPKQRREFLPDENWAVDSPVPSEIITPRPETPAIEFAIPHTREDMLVVVDQAIDYLYGKYAENELFDDGRTSFDDYDPVDENDEPLDAKDKANRVFKNSVFELVRDLMREVYSIGEEKPAAAPWHKTRRKRRPTFCRSTPQSKTEVVSLIREEVARLFGYPESRSKIDPRISLKWGTMKKKDNVDLLLIEELREEEAEWTDYDVDEAAVKMQLADTVFDLLLNDTMSCLNKIDKSKKNLGLSG